MIEESNKSHESFMEENAKSPKETLQEYEKIIVHCCNEVWENYYDGFIFGSQEKDTGAPITTFCGHYEEEEKKDLLKLAYKSIKEKMREAFLTFPSSLESFFKEKIMETFDGIHDDYDNHGSASDL